MDAVLLMLYSFVWQTEQNLESMQQLASTLGQNKMRSSLESLN